MPKSWVPLSKFRIPCIRVQHNTYPKRRIMDRFYVCSESFEHRISTIIFSICGIVDGFFGVITLGFFIPGLSGAWEHSRAFENIKY